MKRSPISRFSPLQRRSPLRQRPKKVSRTESEFLWKQTVSGFCQCGCSRFSLRLERHHVLDAQFLKRERHTAHLWDQRNSMLLHPLCHARHTNAFRRIPIEAVPEAALAFAVDLLGEDRAAVEIARRYGAQVTVRRAA